MERLIDLVLDCIDQKALDHLLGQLRSLDNDLDEQMELVRIAQQNVPIIDRINIFTHSHAELRLKAENKRYAEIREEHSRMVARIKECIRDAIWLDFTVALKVQTSEIMMSVGALQIEHRWGINTKVNQYRIKGIEAVTDYLRNFSEMISTKYGFPHDPVSANDLLELVYDEVLRRGGFIN